MPVRIIVNADDLGISPVVNDAIFRAMERGVITSATMLANGPEVAGAAKLAPRFPNCSFGVHLNLTEFEPLTTDKSLSPLLDERGFFHGPAIREVAIQLPLLKAIYREWSAQVERLVALGIQPSHIDGHHHVHTIPWMLPILRAVRKRFRINKARISMNLYGSSARASRMLLAQKSLFNTTLRAAGFKTTHIFTDFGIYLRVCAEQPPDASTVELMTHPGSSFSDEETQLLAGDWTKRLSYSPVLISYNDL